MLYRPIVNCLLLIILIIDCRPIRNVRSSGFDRLRDRIQRKRHRQQLTSVVQEQDDLFELSSEETRIRLEKSIPLISRRKTKHRHHQGKKNRRERNEELCESQRTTIELNNHSFEFDPPFIVHIRCLNTLTDSGLTSSDEQKCVNGMLRCVQQYSDVHVSRRNIGSMHWHPHTISDVPIACQCMWPVDKYGHQEF